ncbi:TetR family transcriptional regulator [Bordetella pertussis]|nr:TetR family transcriptional regulator [Bordetella pertussis]
MSKAALYHYFPTKQDIYDAIILETLAGLLQAVTREVERQHEACERLRAFMVGHARYL